MPEMPEITIINAFVCPDCGSDLLVKELVEEEQNDNGIWEDVDKSFLFCPHCQPEVVWGEKKEPQVRINWSGGIRIN